MIRHNPANSRRFPSVALTNASQIQGRLRSILDPARNRSGVRRSHTFVIAAMTLMVAPLTLVHVVAQQPPSPLTDTSSPNKASQKPTPTPAKAASKLPPHKAGEAEVRAIRTRLNEQSKLIAALQADHKRETEVLKKQIEALRRENADVTNIARVRAKSDQILAEEHKRLEVMMRASEQLARDNAALSARPGSTSSSDSAAIAGDSRAANPLIAKIELDSQRADISALQADLKRKEALAQAGQLDVATVLSAKLALDRSEIKLKRMAEELAATNDARAYLQQAEMNKRKEEIDMLALRLAQQKGLERAGASTEADVNAAIAQLEHALAELKKRQAELAKKP